MPGSPVYPALPRGVGSPWTQGLGAVLVVGPVPDVVLPVLDLPVAAVDGVREDRSWRRCATSRSACSAWPAGPTSSGPPRRCPAASARPSPSSASSSVEQKGGDHHTAT